MSLINYFFHPPLPKEFPQLPKEFVVMVLEQMCKNGDIEKVYLVLYENYSLKYLRKYRNWINKFMKKYVMDQKFNFFEQLVLSKTEIQYIYIDGHNDFCICQPGIRIDATKLRWSANYYIIVKIIRKDAIIKFKLEMYKFNQTITDIKFVNKCYGYTVIFRLESLKDFENYFANMKELDRICGNFWEIYLKK